MVSVVFVQPIRQLAILPVTARPFTGLRLSIRIVFRRRLPPVGWNHRWHILALPTRPTEPGVTG